MCHLPSTSARRFVRCILIGIVLLPSVQAFCDDAPNAGQQMTQSVAALQQSLTPEQLKLASFAYDDAERLNWHFIPRDRQGLGLWDLEGDALKSAEQFVATGLTAAGYEKVLQVRSLEEVLYLFEGGEEFERRQKRHPHRDYISIFGDPTGTDVWGWRFEGHHLSLNYSIKDGEIVSSTPEFFGANPGLIDAGPGRSLRVLGKREDLARELLRTATDDQKEAMWISKEPPGDIRGAGAAQAEVGDAVGLAVKDMTPEQKQLLRELVGQYLEAMPAKVVAQRVQAIGDAGYDDIHFAWWGGPEKNEPHHYVVQGPTFVIEYNNTQNDANHVHSIWRNLQGDFNVKE